MIKTSYKQTLALWIAATSKPDHCLLIKQSNTKRYEIQTIHRKHNTKLYGGINIRRQSKNSNNTKDKNIEPITKV